MKQPVRITITGAAGNISYSLMFKIASGEMLGDDQPVILQLLEIPQAMEKLEGVAMELEDCAYPLLHEISLHNEPYTAFDNANYAFLVGAKPRSKGMERADLLQANAEIFSEQGAAINKLANRDIKVVVVGSPANTNCLILSRNAPNINPSQFTAMSRLDHNRAVGILSNKLGVNTNDIDGLCVWGNHSPTMYPDIHNAVVFDEEAIDLVDQQWYKKTYIPLIQKRGAQIINARGLSSAASAAQSALDHMSDWALGSDGTMVSMGIMSDGSYGITKGIYYSFPVSCEFGRYQIIRGLEINTYGKEMMRLTEKELLEEKAIIAHLLPKATEKSYQHLAVSSRHNEIEHRHTMSKIKSYYQADRIY